MNEVALPSQRRNLAAGIAASEPLLVVSVLPVHEGLPVLAQLAQSGQSGYSCSPHWVSHWAKNVNTNIIVVTASRNGDVILALALEIVNKSGLKIAQFVGGSHANANFPALKAALSQNEAQQFLVELNANLSRQPWAVDAIMLERQLETLGDYANPLLADGSSTSPNVSLHLNVNQSFDAVLETRSGKRKRKRFRSQQRKFEAAGGFNIVSPVPKEANARTLEQYFAMKADQLSGKGVTNVFGNDKEQSFFKALFSNSSPQQDHHFFLSSLEVQGKTRAVYGSSYHGMRQMVHFTAFADDELTAASPGDFLNFALVEAACRSTLEIYDLGVGDEGYKRSWCDVETWHRDTVVGLSLRGKLAKIQIDIARFGKRWIKNNEKLWSFVKRIRKLKGAKTTETKVADAAKDSSEL